MRQMKADYVSFILDFSVYFMVSIRVGSDPLKFCKTAINLRVFFRIHFCPTELQNHLMVTEISGCSPKLYRFVTIWGRSIA